MTNLNHFILIQSNWETIQPSEDKLLQNAEQMSNIQDTIQTSCYGIDTTFLEAFIYVLKTVSLKI